jgi:hypothetical protein
MSRRTKYTTEEKYEILNEYDNGIGTMRRLLVSIRSIE